MSHILRRASPGLALSAAIGIAGTAQAAVGHAKAITAPTTGDVTLVVPTGSYSTTSLIIYPSGGNGSTKNSNTATIKGSNGSVFVEDGSSTTNGGAGFNFTSPTDFGTQVVETASAGKASGPMTITFTNPVSEFGFYLRDNSGKNGQSGTFTFTITDTSSINNTTTLTEAFTNSSLSKNTLPMFFGAQATFAGIYIKSVTVADTLMSASGGGQDLVIGSIKENTPTIPPAPEPSAAVALGLGSLSLMAARLRARRRPTV